MKHADMAALHCMSGCPAHAHDHDSFLQQAAAHARVHQSRSSPERWSKLTPHARPAAPCSGPPGHLAGRRGLGGWAAAQRPALQPLRLVPSPALSAYTWRRRRAAAAVSSFSTSGGAPDAPRGRRAALDAPQPCPGPADSQERTQRLGLRLECRDNSQWLSQERFWTGGEPKAVQVEQGSQRACWRPGRCFPCPCCMSGALVPASSQHFAMQLHQPLAPL